MPPHHWVAMLPGEAGLAIDEVPIDTLGVDPANPRHTSQEELESLRSLVVDALRVAHVDRQADTYRRNRGRFRRPEPSDKQAA
jgi:hypothetical protein